MLRILSTSYSYEWTLRSPRQNFYSAPTSLSMYSHSFGTSLLSWWITLICNIINGYWALSTTLLTIFTSNLLLIGSKYVPNRSFQNSNSCDNWREIFPIKKQGANHSAIFKSNLTFLIKNPLSPIRQTLHQIIHITPKSNL